MTTISGMFGQTPRMMNRFVNIYRIIKSHQSYRVSQTGSPRDYKATMLALAVIVGNPVKAKEFVSLLEVTDSPTFTSLLEDLKDEDLKRFIKENVDNTIFDDLTPPMLKRNLELISRFSFRTYNALKSPPTPLP